MTLLGIRSARRPRPVTLPQYSRQHVSLLRRLGRWAAVVGLAFFCLIYGFFYALVTPYLFVQTLTPIGILALLVIWALPEFGRAPTGPMVWLFWAFFVTLFVWPSYLAVALPGLPWITFIRLTSFPMALALLISVSISAEFRRRIGEALSAAPIIWKLLTAFAVIQLLSIALSDKMAFSVQRFVNAQVTWTAVFFVACYVFLRPGRVERFAAVLWAIAIFVSLVGTVEHAMGHVPWAGYIPSFLKIEDETVQRILAGGSRAATGLYRVQSTFTTSLGLAEFLALCVPFILHFAVENYRVPIRVAAIATIPFLLWVVITTDSRLGMVGFLLAVLLYPLFWGVLRWRRNPGSIFGPAIVLAYPAFFVAGITATMVIGRLRNRVWGNGAHQASNEGRLEQYQAGLPMIAKNPFGHGVGMGGETLGYSTQGGQATIDTYYLAIALEYGIIGFIVYYGMILATAYFAAKYAAQDRRPDRDTPFLVPLAIAVFSFFVIKGVFSNQDNHPLIFMMMGATLALVRRVKDRESRPTNAVALR